MKINPYWIPSSDIQQECERQREIFMDIFETGSENELGDAKIRLNHANYLIHGSNLSSIIGLNASHKCIHPENGYVRLQFDQLKLDAGMLIIQPIEFIRRETRI